MKKNIVIAGIVILLVMSSVTCDAFLPDDEVVEYTDVVYSKDGSQVTIYLDGTTVPVTRAQRALTRELALMSYDYLEVVFVNAGGIARSSWELGQTAGISGSGLRIGGNYGVFTGGTESACLFAGVKSGKTLLGVGKMISSTPKGGAEITTNPPINANTESVKFGLVAIQTGLLISSDGGESTKPRGINVHSFTYTTGTGAATGYTTLTTGNSRLQAADGIDYPTYSLPTATGDVAYATYTFKFITNPTGTWTDSTSDYLAAVKHVVSATKYPVVQKRTPRFMAGGRYLQPSGHIDTKTQLALGATYAAVADNANFTNVVDLKFTIAAGSTGIFSFYLEIPVFNLNNGIATHSGDTAAAASNAPITWYVRTGLGSELYSLDDGTSSGGCVLMNVGMTASDWIDITWDWVP